MALRKEMRLHQRVMLILDGVKGYVPGDLKKHNKEIFRISKVHRLYPKGKTQRCVYYELEGLTSVRGVPYGIQEEWIYDIEKGFPESWKGK